MRTPRSLASTAVLALTLSSASFVGMAAQSADAHTIGLHDNCTNFNKKFPNGVGLRGARDQGGDSTNFLRSKRIYWRAENHNGDLDRDNDRIACERS